MNNTDNNDRRFQILLYSSAIIITILVFIFNDELFFFFNHKITPYTSGILWGYITQFGDGFIAAFIIILMINRYPDLMAKGFIALLLGLVVSQGGKSLIGGPRPLAFFGEELVNIIGPALSHRSFPSGHTTAAAIVGILMYNHRLAGSYRFIWLVIAFFVGLSRIVIGVHHPRDVVGGFWIALFLVWLAGVIVNKYPSIVLFWRKKKVRLTINILLFATIPFMFINFSPSQHFPFFYIGLALIVIFAATKNIWDIFQDG